MEWTITWAVVWMNFRNTLCRRSQDPKDYTFYDSIYVKAELIYGDKNQDIGYL